jgi:TfoX/Sxy family transcriptional regulator of competence genes
MASSADFVQYVCDQLSGTGTVRNRKMFGDYMVYVNDRPLVLVCEDTAYLKELDCVRGLLADAPRGVPYEGAREHFILDVDDRELCTQAIAALLAVTPLPAKKKRSAAKKGKQHGV